MPTTLNPELEADRVRRYTSPGMLKRIEDRIEHNIRFYAVQPRHVVDRRIEQLKCEWSMERYLQANAASVGLTTALLGLFCNRKWALLTCGALGFFLYHGVRGFDPPIPLLRRMGVRTRGEVDRELYALKAVRGDFRELPEKGEPGEEFPARRVLKAVNG